MSSNFAEDDDLYTKSSDEPESPRKHPRLDGQPRKIWSFMDRRTDQEVLQEMGVSVLEPDDGELLRDGSSGGMNLKPTLKRKHDIENVNPNVNSVTSPRGRPGARSPRRKGSPAAGPSGVRSPRSGEKCKPLQSTDHQTLETTLVAEYLDEETPLAQSFSARHAPSGRGVADSVASSGGKRFKSSFTPHEVEECLFSPRSLPDPEGVDSFSVLSDEMMLSIFRWLPKRTLAHGMMVCKRWHRVAMDETLWQRLDLGNKVLSEDALGRVLARKPVIVRLASSEIGAWHPTHPATPSRVQYLDLSMCTVDCATLSALLDRCPLLRKLSLENVDVTDDTCRIIGKCRNLETLNLTMAKGVTAAGLTMILEGCKNLLALNISWCNLSEEAMEVVVTMLPPRLQRLNLGGARVMTDDMVSKLVERCRSLLELDLSDCSLLGVGAVQRAMVLRRLEHLALSRCYLLPPHALTKLGSMASLRYLEVWGMLQTPSLDALRAAIPGVQVNQFMLSAIARPTVGPRRTSIWGLRTRD